MNASVSYFAAVPRAVFNAVLLGAVALVLLVACSTTEPGNGKVERANIVVMTDPKTGKEVYTTSQEAYSYKSFFSAANLRETVFSNDTTPRFSNSNVSSPSGAIQTDRLNGGPTAMRQSDQGYLAELIPTEPEIQPISPQEVIGGLWQPRFSATETVQLNFDNEPLTGVVQNVLGGILGANFVIGDGVEGTITFRSEQRFTKAQLVQVLADILSRSGYLVQFVNGVYHVGTQEDLLEMATVRGGSTTEGTDVRTVRITRGSAEELVDVLSILLPAGNAVVSIPGTNNLAIRGDPTQFAAVEELINTLVDTGIARQSTSIIPLRESAPEVVAAELSSFFEARGFEGVTVIPLEARQALLIAAESRQTMRAARELVRELDVDRRDRPSLRVIQLTHLPVEETAAQLQQIFEDGVPTAAPEEPQTGGSNILAAADQIANPGRNDSIPAPRLAGGSGSGAPSGDTETAAPGGQANPGRLGEGGEISIAADRRNNALLVRSTYAEFIRIQEVVRALDMPLAQVAIEATIIEVDISDQLEYGVQSFLQGTGITLRASSITGAADPGGSGFAAVLTGSGSTSVSAVISALQSVTNVRVISSPYVSVVDGATSRLSVADQIPFVIASQSSSTGGTVTVTQEIDTRDVGVILEVTPQIRPNNSVLMDIVQEVSSARTTSTIAGENPVVSSRRVSSQINVDSGFTVLLGGLITERQDVGKDGVPVLSRVPVVGTLFGTTSNTQTRSELLIMITPRVVRNSNGLSHLTEQLRMSTVLR